MSSRHILVIDAGTSAVRCFVYDSAGTVLAQAAAPWRFAQPVESSPLAREIDPEAAWSDIWHASAASVAESGASREINAVAVTGQRQGVVFLDRAGRELYAGPNLDLRAVFEGGEIDEEFGDRFYRTTGHSPSFFFTAAKLKWMRDHRSNVYDNVATVLTLPDWIAWRLTGERVSEVTLAGEAGLLDITSREWCDEFLEAVGADIPAPATLVESGFPIGSIVPDVAQALGLGDDTLVVAAAADTQAGLLGLGVVEPGQAGIVAGWSVPVQIVTDRPVLDKDGKTWAGCHAIQALWTLESTAGDAGNAYRWLSDTLYAGSPDPFGEMDAAAAAEPAGSDGAMAFAGPARMDMTALGLRAGGIVFPVPITFNEPSRGQIVRAFLEATAYAVRANLEQAESLLGAQASTISVGGGMTKTRTFAEILAEVLGRDIGVSSTDNVSAYGAYLCAMTGLAEYGSLREAARPDETSLCRLEPSSLEGAIYADGYARWLEAGCELEAIAL